MGLLIKLIFTYEELQIMPCIEEQFVTHYKYNRPNLKKKKLKLIRIRYLYWIIASIFPVSLTF